MAVLFVVCGVTACLLLVFGGVALLTRASEVRYARELAAGTKQRATASRPRVALSESLSSTVPRIRGRDLATTLNELEDLAASMLNRPLTQWGPFHVLETLGKGANAVVYRAYDPALDRYLALKLRVLDKDSESDAMAEARQLAKVNHRNVLNVYGAGIHDGYFGIYMELIGGETLRDMIEKRGPLSPAKAAAVGMDLALALSALHAAGIVHRDLSPTNVMREPDGRIVLMDFGSATEVAALGAGTRLRGTPLTMAPELFQGKPPNPSTDIYSLGALLFHLVTGRYPIEARSVSELTARHERHRPPRLLDVRPDVAESFARVVERALAMNPAERYASADEMGRALGAYIVSDKHA